ncbi:hypothetical protein STENM36S_03310 [Streptomyces tendae]
MSAFGSRSARSEGVVQGAEPGREGDRARPLGPERHPHVPAPDLVARPLDQEPPARVLRHGREPRAQPPPDGGHLVLVVLAQHVRRADQQRRPGDGDLEAAVPEIQPRARVRPGRRHPGRVDLDAHHARVRRDRAQAVQQFHGGPGGGAVAEVDGDGLDGAAQFGTVHGRDPAVHAAQPVGIGRPARDRAHGAGGGGAGWHDYEGMRPAVRHSSTGWWYPHTRAGLPAPPTRVGDPKAPRTVERSTVMIRQRSENRNGAPPVRCSHPLEGIPGPPTGMPAARRNGS